MVGFVPTGNKTIMQVWIIRIEGSMAILNVRVPECYKNADLANGGIIDGDIFAFNIPNHHCHQHGFNHLSSPFEYQGMNWEYITGKEVFIKQPGQPYRGALKGGTLDDLDSPMGMGALDNIPLHYTASSPMGAQDQGEVPGIDGWACRDPNRVKKLGPGPMISA
ncbi:hypothetical protein BS47DRAFT_1364742 [Hydnum rufescens UP504]|uniref:Uncharacterized protein n=1 Tax=Hydnum rufescens UP504 TaxID=1448309 RepID=A0A9P6DPM9_9AGAM|nr:hypothetical protein BS47DRAFT_1364742 [Hydnum rufescens UP504]